MHVLAPTESAQHVRPRKVHVTSPLFVHRRPVCTRVSGAGYGCKGGVEGGGGSGGLERRGRPLFRVLLGIFGGTRRICARGKR